MCSSLPSVPAGDPSLIYFRFLSHVRRDHRTSEGEGSRKEKGLSSNQHEHGFAELRAALRQGELSCSSSLTLRRWLILKPSQAPKTCYNFIMLAKAGKYDE